MSNRPSTANLNPNFIWYTKTIYAYFCMHTIATYVFIYVQC